MLVDRRPDADKNEEELRRELGQLRDVWRLDLFTYKFSPTAFLMTAFHRRRFLPTAFFTDGVVSPIA